METQQDQSTTLTITDPALNFRMATDVAGICREIVVKTSLDISGRKYVRAEGWQAIAVAHGCFASSGKVEFIEGGVRAVGYVRRQQGGEMITLASAEGFVGNDEPRWNERPEYARRAMAQTRAISRACRSAFAHVVVLMDAGLETTPAEEVPDGGFDDATTREPARSKPTASNGNSPKGSSIASKGTRQPNAPSEAPQGAPSSEYDWRNAKIHFGKNSGKALGELAENSRNYYLVKWQPDASRTSKADQSLRDACDDCIKEFDDDAPLRAEILKAIREFGTEQKLDEQEREKFGDMAKELIERDGATVSTVENMRASQLYYVYLKRDVFLSEIRK